MERREIFSAYQAVVKESTRAKQQLRSMLNEHSARLEKGFRLCHPNAITRLLKLPEWTAARRMLLQQLHGSLVAARARRTLLRRHMAQEIVAEEAQLITCSSYAHWRPRSAFPLYGRGMLVAP